MTKHCAIIVIETGRTRIMPKHVKHLELRPWKHQQAHSRNDSETIANIKPTAALDFMNKFPSVFLKEKNISLPPPRTINHHLVVMKEDLIHILVPIKLKAKFLEQLCHKLEQEEYTERIYKSNKTSCCAMFTIAEISDATKPRFLHDPRNRNKNVVLH